MTTRRAVVIGIGNPYRRDDGIGPALAERLDPLELSNVDIQVLDGEPTGRSAASSHGMGVPEAVELGTVLNRMPDRLIVYAVEAADVGYGTELSPEVAAALPELLDAVLTDLEGADPAVNPMGLQR